MAALRVTDVRELRAGGQKTVRLVDRAGVEVVMKVIALESGAPEALDRAQREVDLLQGIDNDHVVKVASALEQLGSPVQGVAWLEEYLEGEDLSDHLGPQWDWDAARTMAVEVADGLSAIHAVKVVHRDLSANNIRRRSDGHWVVMDPGFARHTLRSGLTVGGQPGTPGFLSPEHLQSFSGAPTPASDVFCVGILIFAALTGQLPIPYAGDLADYLDRLSRVEATAVEALRADLSPERRAIVRLMLHPQSARRPKNGAQLAEALEGLP
jgi:serine/threonine-protein kinase